MLSVKVQIKVKKTFQDITINKVYWMTSYDKQFDFSFSNIFTNLEIFQNNQEFLKKFSGVFMNLGKLKNFSKCFHKESLPK
jgi:hypothetical protein